MIHTLINEGVYNINLEEVVHVFSKLKNLWYLLT